MAGFAKPAKKMVVIKVSDKNEFIKKFNDSMPSKETKEKADKAMKTFKWAK